MNWYPLTNNPDIDYQILMEVPFNELKVLCRTNKYTRVLCQNKTFWINKLIHDDIPLPSSELLTNDLNWVKAYDVLNWINEYTDESLKRENGTTAIINQNNQDTYNYLLEKHQLPKYDYDDITYINYYFSKWRNLFYLSFIYNHTNHGPIEYDHAYISYQQLVDFLFEAMMNNVIIKLEKTNNH